MIVSNALTMPIQMPFEWGDILLPENQSIDQKGAKITGSESFKMTCCLFKMEDFAYRYFLTLNMR